MKTKIPFFASAAVSLLITLTPNLGSAQAPTGNISTNITNPTNAIFDITEVSDLKHASFDVNGNSTSLHIAFDVDFDQSGGGKLAGADTNVVSLTVDSVPQPDFAAAYVVKGAVTSVKGVGRLSISESVTGTAFLNGANRKASASEKRSVIINPVTLQIVSGTFSRKASATGLGGASESGTLSPQALPAELGDGSWTLSMDLQPDVNNKYTGVNNTATVTLMTGMVYHFTIVGNFNATTHVSKFVLKGVDEAQGSSLKVTMLDNAVTTILGKVSGQAISLK
jgi:hypothetical protein